MLLHDAPRYLAPHKRQVFETMAQEAMQAREDERRREAAGMARKPKGDRMNTDGSVARSR